MDNNINPEKDPWANMGNTLSNKEITEVSPEQLQEAEKWENTMKDVEFSGNSLFPENIPEENNNKQQNNPEITPESENDKYISEAATIINYGLNAVSKEKGVETAFQMINNFVPNNQEDPINQLYKEFGIDTEKEFKDLENESETSKPEENLFRENINASPTTEKSKEGALKAIQNVKELVAEVQTSPIYGGLRKEAMSAGKGVFEYAVDKYEVRDLTVLLGALNEIRKEAMVSKLAEENNKVSNSTQETENNPQIENQLSTENSPPDTDATERIGL